MALTQEDQALIPADITDQQKQWLEQACICSEFFRDQLRKQPEWGHVWLEKMQDSHKEP